MNDINANANAISLSALSAGERARVLEVSRESALRRRLFDVGLTEGGEVECVGVSPMGDPKAYFIRGAVIAIRNRDAHYVRVQRVRTECQNK